MSIHDAEAIARLRQQRVERMIEDALRKRLTGIIEGGRVLAPALSGDITSGTVTVDGAPLTGGGGGGTCMEPLTNGDPAAPALVFTPDGDVIMTAC